MDSATIQLNVEVIQIEIQVEPNLDRAKLQEIKRLN